MTTKYRYASITEVSELIRQKKLSPVELVTECLENIKHLQPKLNAFITVTAEQALKEAKIAETEIQNDQWKGPLHGIPIGIKDLFDTADIRTTAAFAAFKDRIPAKDAVSVTKLKDAGAIVLGKLNLHELAMGTTSAISYFGAVHNPWQTDFVAGGSSGGSAAAIAAGLCYATLDTDAVGSCRLPASCCGVMGFKATYGLLNPGGILEGERADDFIILLSHPSFMCRSSEDAAILLNVLANPEVSPDAYQNDYRSAFGATKKPVLGIVQNFNATDEVRAAFLSAVQTLQTSGYTTTEVDAPLTIASFDLENLETIRANISPSLFQDIDLFLLPTTTNVTPTIEDAQAIGAQAVAPDNTFFCNYYGLPAVSVPCGLSKNGLPLGLQIVGPRWGESTILQVAQTFQHATQWHIQHPILD